MKNKFLKKLLASMLTLACIMPNSLSVSAASTQPTVEITAEDTTEVTTDVNETLSGSITGNGKIETVTYTATSELTDGEAYIEDAEATVKGDEWSIDDLTLMPGENTITVTATTESGKTATETIELEYDMGSVKDPESFSETEDGTAYADNQIMVMFESNVSQERIKEIIASVGGKVIGSIYVLDEYQIEVADTDHDGLMRICEILEAYDEVIIAELNTAMTTNDIVLPNDPWTSSDDWNEENPNGSNWGLEAIQAPSAWQYNDLLTECMVGVVDSGFQTNHPDLTVNFASDTIRNYNYPDSHGTHVAGTIGAKSNNGVGITGINWKAKIYGGSCQPAGLPFFSDAKITYNITELVQSGAKVLNGSFGIHNPPTTDDFVLSQGSSAALRMAKLLASGYDFIFVQSAGNDSINARYNGNFCSVEGNTPVTVDGVSIQDILDRKIVVAAAENAGNGTYTLASYSNWGENVDIAAPGSSVYSTITDSDYAYFSGTSMAAPHTTGVVSLVWSANPNLTAPEVKNIIVNSTCDTVPTIYSNDPVGQYKMLNAKLAVEKALSIGTLTVSTPNTVSIVDATNVALAYEATNTNSNCSYRFGTIFNGKEYELSNGYQTTNRIHVNFHTALSDDALPNANAVGTHTLFVDVKDGKTGSVLRKTIENYVIEGLKITSFEANKTSPQKLGTSIQLNATVENEGGYRYNTYKFTATKDGVETNLSPSGRATYNVTWTPEEPGTYTLKYYIRDYLGQEATKEMKYIISSATTAYVFYNNSSWDTANIHYKIGNGTWTTAPGVAMENSTLDGYTWCYAIELGKAANATVCFNNGNNTWDSNSGKNYTVTKGLNGIGGENLTFAIKSITGTPTKSAPSYNVQLSGGVAPYTYSYEFIDKATKEVVLSGESTVSSVNALISPYGSRRSGNYTFNITCTDAYGQTATATKDYTLKPFTISDITASVNSPQLPNTEITLTAQYENEFIYKYGLVGNWTITNKTTNTTETFTSYYTRELVWIPTEIGEYEITVSTTDHNGETATHTINYSIADEIRNEATVYYYNSSFTKAYIHYKVGNGTWTTAPGIQMENSNEQSGYSWKYVIDLEDADLATVCFNNGSGSWDSNNGNNYNVYTGISGIKSGVVNKLTPAPTATPTVTATVTPTVKPTSTPSATPTVKPTSTPSATPTVKPTSTPSATPTPVITKTTVYYSNSSWTQAYIHYKVGNGNWTTAPGVKMEDNTSDNGYTWKYVIDLGDADNTTVCFNNGNGNWDSNNGNNYPLNAGSYGIKNKTTEELPEGLDVSLELYGTRGSSSARATVADGVAPYTYSYVVTRNGEITQEGTYTSTLDYYTYTVTSYDGGTYKVDVVVTDAEGKTGTATDTKEFKPLYIADITADLASPQKTGTTVTFTADIQSEYYYKFPNYRNWSITKAGVSYGGGSSYANEITYTFEEEGTYDITCSTRDASGQTATKTIQFVVSDATNIATIYYNASWNNAYIHYCIAGESWTAVPGMAMTKTSEKPGYTHKYVINLNDAENVVACFNNGSGSWDSKNGSNYTINAGTYGISNGSISKLQ